MKQKSLQSKKLSDVRKVDSLLKHIENITTRGHVVENLLHGLLCVYFYRRIIFYEFE